MATRIHRETPSIAACALPTSVDLSSLRSDSSADLKTAGNLPEPEVGAGYLSNRAASGVIGGLRPGAVEAGGRHGRPLANSLPPSSGAW